MSAAATSQPYGHMTVERWWSEGHFGKRVFVEDMDVTDRCRWFDDTIGQACIYTESPPVADADGNLRTTILRGRIEVRS